MHRFYADGAVSSEGRALLSAEDTSHALRVLRMHAGDALELMCDGKRYSAVLETETGAQLSARILQELPSAEPALKVTLYQGLPKADKMELIVQKATEAGITSVVPVMMERCVSRPDAKDSVRKQERWQKIAREAGKQSGRSLIPEVTLPVKFSDLPQLLKRHDAVAVPWEDQEGNGPKAFAAAHPEIRSLGIVIGPEGGIDPKEIAVLTETGCIPVTLGPRILRTETAGLAALCAFMCLYGEME